MTTYEAFLRAKVLSVPDMGIIVTDDEINPILKPHQRAIVKWCLRRGRAAIFAAFSLGKTMMQLEILRLLLKHVGGRGLIVCPLGVRFEFFVDTLILMAGDDPGITDAQRAELCRWHAQDPSNRFPPLRFVRSIEECEQDVNVAPLTNLFITNYETVRDGKLDPHEFTAVSLDEAAVLRGFGGTKTFRKLMGYFEGSGIYRFVATATPDPNDTIEILAYSAFLDVMDISAAKTKFFKRDSEHADELTLMPSREQDFYEWCREWSVWVQTPSDLGFSDEGYVLQEMDVNWIEIPSSYENAGVEPNGQGRLIPTSVRGLSAGAKEKRNSIDQRIAKLREVISDDILFDDQFIVWCELNDEQRSVDHFLKEIGVKFSSLYGNQDIDDREVLMQQWRDRKTAAFVSKSSMYGAGSNLQQAWHEIFLGVNYKFYSFIQAIHRVQRFGQKHKVQIDIIYTETERAIRLDLEAKWENHKRMVANMTAIIRRYGLGANAMDQAVRKMEVTRKERRGENWILVNNDCVPETAAMTDDSVDLILTSIPFSTQYEYSPSFRDFGHTESNEHFWQQMDFLIPELYRVLKPGRVAAIHVKDRITPSGMTGMGFQTVYRFSDACCGAFEKHGFGMLARKTIVTDVVRENNQTYRLGWTEQCKDGSRMGNGLPEYLLVFRKPPTDTSNGYADVPVVKDKAKYTRSRWQIDAHGFMRSNGDRLLCPEDLEGAPHERIFKLFRQDSMRNVYSFERHVGLSELLERCRECGHIHIGSRCCGYGDCECKIDGGRLPANFMLLQPQSWHPDVWTDVTRMRTLNLNQAQGNREMHVCPLQFDIVDRAIEQYTMKGEVVYDPFSGIGTVPMRAVKLGRFGRGTELAEMYFEDGVRYCEDVERELSTPTLFDLLAEEATA